LSPSRSFQRRFYFFSNPCLGLCLETVGEYHPAVLSFSSDRIANQAQSDVRSPASGCMPCFCLRTRVFSALFSGSVVLNPTGGVLPFFGTGSASLCGTIAVLLARLSLFTPRKPPLDGLRSPVHEERRVVALFSSPPSIPLSMSRAPLLFFKVFEEMKHSSHPRFTFSRLFTSRFAPLRQASCFLSTSLLF